MINVLELIESYGLKFEPLQMGRYCWEGDGLIRSDTPSNILHELAHYQISTIERRLLINYGLGQCPDELKTLPKSMAMTYDKAQYEEELASVLGIMWEKHLGFNWQNTLDLHDWNYMQRPELFEERIQNLIDLGFLSKDRDPIKGKLNEN